MKVEFISAKHTNGEDNLFADLSGLKGELSISSNLYFNFTKTDSLYEENEILLEELKEKNPNLSFEMRHGIFRTSTYKSIQRNEISRFCWDYIVTTNGGSIYTFREGTFSDKKPLTEEERLGIMSTFLF